MSGSTGTLGKLLVSLLIVILVIGASISFFAIRFLATPAPGSGEEVVYEVKPGESFKTVTRQLEAHGLTTSAWKLEVLGRMSGASHKMRIGEYAIKSDLKPRALLHILVSGQSIQHAITFSEGLNRFEIADIIEHEHLGKRAEVLSLSADPNMVRELLGRDETSLEGYLFPETYFVTKYTNVRTLLRMMVDRFKENFAKARATQGWSLGGLSEREIVTLASIIEKETGAPEERSVISSVFYNRLHRDIALQTDPTIIYGIYAAKGAWNGALGKADLQRPSPYNTYLNHGLPPGPISNPGLEALKAAGHPAESDFLFFVSRNDGTHVFSRDYAQHLKAVTNFQLDRRAREGKSWRDLSNRKLVPDKVIEAPKAKTPKQHTDGKDHL